MELKLASADRPPHADKPERRRSKLVRRIDQQLAQLKTLGDGEGWLPSWVWISDTGTYYVPLRYGRVSLELKKGMFSVECSNLDEVENALCQLRAMVVRGDLDSQLEAAAGQLRAGFASQE